MNNIDFLTNPPQALKIFKKHEITDGRCGALYADIAALYVDQGRFGDGIKYGERALAIFERKGDDAYASDVCQWLALANRGLRNMTKAKQYAERALRYGYLLQSEEQEALERILTEN